MAILLCIAMPDDTVTSYLPSNGITYIYTTENLVAPECTSIPSGNGYIIKCDSTCSHALLTQLNKNKVLGVSFEIPNCDFNTLTQKLNLQLICSQIVEDIVFVYGYSPRLSKFITVDGEKINIQVAKRGDIVKVGYPLILDSV